MTAPRREQESGRPQIPLRILLVLAACGGMGPFAIDAYLAGFPRIAGELQTSASAVQLTLTGFMLTMGLLQLVIGPLSDQLGRRKLLMIGIGGSGLAAAICALAPSIEVLILARLLQGAFGAAAVVLSRAIIADLASGSHLARAFALLMTIQSVAPVIAPGIGGLVVATLGWRAVFWMLVLITAALVMAVLTVIPESLPPEQRAAGGLRPALRDMAGMVHRPDYLMFVTMYVAAFVTLMAYVSASSFVLQNVVGLTAGQYTVAFTVNSSSLIVASLISSRILRGPTQPFTIVRIAGAAQTAVVLWLALTVFVLDTPAWAILAGFFALVGSTGFIVPNVSALAIAAAGERRGTGSALMGATQMAMAAATAPLTGLGGESDARPMVWVMLAATTVLTCTFVLAEVRRRRGR